MQAPNFILLYVENPQASAAFYEKLLSRPPIESSKHFAMFGFDTGLCLGLWMRDDVQPKPSSKPGAAEVLFPIETRQAVDTLCADWRKLGLSIAQEPTTMDFGYTFVALDPDGHRLRACKLTP
jgi:predicted enzyme related to lactoylglutathione lyase